MVMAVLPPLPAAAMASAPSRRSFFESVVHSLAICGQITPWTPPRLRNFTCAARHCRSNALASVNGDAPIGKSPRIGLAALSAPGRRPIASAPAPKACRNFLLPVAGTVIDGILTFLL